MKNLLLSFASVFIVNESIVCWNYGSFSTDSSLITYSQVHCSVFPLSDSALACLEDNNEVRLLEDIDEAL